MDSSAHLPHLGTCRASHGNNVNILNGDCSFTVLHSYEERLTSPTDRMWRQRTAAMTSCVKITLLFTPMRQPGEDKHDWGGSVLQSGTRGGTKHSVPTTGAILQNSVSGMLQHDVQYLHTCFETRCACHSTSRAKCQQHRKNWAVANSAHVEELSDSLDPNSHQLPHWTALFCFILPFIC